MITLQTNSNYPLSNVSVAAKIHPSVRVEPFTTIHDDVEIGEGTYIGSNVTIHSGTKIGSGCYISSGVVINPDKSRLEFWQKDAKLVNGRRPLISIEDRVHIEPSTSLHGEITIADEAWIGSNVSVFDGARIGKRCKIFPGASISAIPQDLKFHGERTTLEIGENTTIRECVTLNRGTEYNGTTIIGRNCLIMAYVHVAHDCVIGDNVIIANAVNMGGHVEIEDFAVIGGASAIHQFVKIGKHVMLSGGSLVAKDIPPFIKAGRFPTQYDGINSIGLRRRGFKSEIMNQIQEIYRQIFLLGKNTSNALEYIEAHLPPSEERDEVLTFIRSGNRGIIKGHHYNSNGHSSNGHSSNGKK